MGSTWRRVARAQPPRDRGSEKAERARDRRRGRGCAKAHGLKSPGAAALWAPRGPGSCGGRGRRVSGRAEAQRLAGGAETSRVCRGPGARGGLEEARRGWGACKGLAAYRGPGARRAGGRASGRGLETRHLHPPGLWNFLPGRTPRALPRPTREPRSHHLARRAELAAAVGSSGRGDGGFAVRRRAGYNGAWTRTEAGGVRVGDASAGGEGCSFTLTGCPDSLQRLALTATSRHGTGRAEGGASAGRGGAELAGGRHPGTSARLCTRSPTGLLAEPCCRSASAFCVRCAGGLGEWGRRLDVGEASLPVM